MDIKASINATREGFEQSFSSGNFYNKQTQDSEHLEQIMNFLPIKNGMKILDLGAGSGYMSFPIAKSNASCKIIGLDIVFNTLAANRVRADKEGLRNLSFVCYDGIEFPFETNSFDMVITRYALHHFPDIDYSISEVARVLKTGGSFFISDPCPNDCDNDRFVDEYMQLKKDGHIKFYTEDEWCCICGKCGMELTSSFKSKIRFPKKKETAYGYEDVLKKHNRSVIESYNLIETDTEIYITENVNNIMFLKM
ncbi:MAG: class I SAM-dependent methyltransferase [Porcipelethomonas sp.]